MSNFDENKWSELWKSAYRVLEDEIVPSKLETWIKPLVFVGAEEGIGGAKVSVRAPSDFWAKFVRDHYKQAIEAALHRATSKHCELVILAQEEGTSTETQAYQPPIERPTQYLQNAGLAEERGKGEENRYAGPASVAHEARLDSRYMFENFVVGASNQFAHASCVAVAENPGRQYNPLFLYGPPGLGKTHLLHAIGNHLLAKSPNARVAYLSAESFVNELIDSLQHKKMPQFRARYRDSFDLILIDDIQFIAGKKSSEEEFFHTFNALHASKRQIVVSSDRPPKEIEGLEERIRTRFEWGLISDISPPEIETRIAILKTKAERDDIYLPDDVATFLATNIKSNVRELEGILIRLQAQASLTGAEISLEMAKHEIKIAVPEEGTYFTAENILNAVAKHFRIKVQELKSTTRARSIALPRQIAMYLMRKYTNMGFKEIGQYFGGKDHSTIMHGCRKIEEDLDKDAVIRDAVEAIQNLL